MKTIYLARLFNTQNPNPTITPKNTTQFFYSSAVAGFSVFFFFLVFKSQNHFNYCNIIFDCAALKKFIKTNARREKSTFSILNKSYIYKINQPLDSNFFFFCKVILDLGLNFFFFLDKEFFKKKNNKHKLWIVWWYSKFSYFCYQVIQKKEEEEKKIFSYEIIKIKRKKKKVKRGVPSKFSEKNAIVVLG